MLSPTSSTSTTSPGCRAFVPAGVPVATISPGSRVMNWEMNDSSIGIGNTMSAAVARWHSTPFTRVISVIPDRSAGAALSGPIGQKVSMPFARDHWLSLRCRSRAVTSFSATMPAMPAMASSSVAFVSRLPITSAISPSNSMCVEIGCSTIASPSRMIDDGGLRKNIGSVGTSLPISRAWAT